MKFSEYLESKEVSCGVLIFFNDSVLLCHPKSASWWGTYQPPKGLMEKGETEKQTALRELREEVGITLKASSLKNRKEVVYKNGKTVIIFQAVIKSLEQIGLQDLKVPKTQLQSAEIDWAGFMTIESAEKRILPIFKDLIKSRS